MQFDIKTSIFCHTVTDPPWLKGVCYAEGVGKFSPKPTTYWLSYGVSQRWWTLHG